MRVRLLALSLLAIGCWSCSTSRTAAPMELLPADTVIAVSANWQEIGKDSHLQRLANTQVVNKLLQSYGVDPLTVTKLVLFSKRLNAGDGDIGMILSGSYNQQRLIEKARSQNFTRQTYQGREFYCDEARDRTLCVLRGGLVSLGARELVEETLAVTQTPAKALLRQSPMRRIVKASRERSLPLEVFVFMPQEIEDMTNVALHMSSFLLDLAGIGVIGKLLNTIGFVRALNCSLVRRGKRFAVELNAVLKDERAASLISGSLNLLKTTSRLMPRQQMNETDQATMERFDDLNVTRNEEVLIVSMTISEEETVR
jgi:hypothetical protein